MLPQAPRKGFFQICRSLQSQTPNRHIKAVLCLTVIGMIAASVAFGDDIPHRTKPKPNAALIYWQAFALLPIIDEKNENLRDHVVNMGFNDLSEQDQNRVKRIAALSKSSINTLHKASILNFCDWGTDLSDGVSTRVAQFEKAKEIGILAVLNAEVAFSKGNSLQGINDIKAALRLSRHLVDDVPLVQGWLVGLNIEKNCIRCICRNLGRMQSDEREEWLSYFEDLPVWPALAELEANDQMMASTGFLRLIKDAASNPEQQKDVMKGARSIPHISLPENISFATLAEMVELWDQSTTQIVGIMSLSANDRVVDLEKLHRDLDKQGKKSMLALLGLRYSITNCYIAKRGEIQRAALRIAIGLYPDMKNPPASIEDTKTQISFSCKATRSGVDIQADGEVHGRPILMSIK